MASLIRFLNHFSKLMHYAMNDSFAKDFTLCLKKYCFAVVLTEELSLNHRKSNETKHKSRIRIRCARVG